jgi:hypothetical protein
MPRHINRFACRGDCTHAHKNENASPQGIQNCKAVPVLKALGVRSPRRREPKPRQLLQQRLLQGATRHVSLPFRHWRKRPASASLLLSQHPETARIPTATATFRYSRGSVHKHRAVACTSAWPECMLRRRGGALIPDEPEERWCLRAHPRQSRNPGCVYKLSLYVYVYVYVYCVLYTCVYVRGGRPSRDAHELCGYRIRRWRRSRALS